VGRVLGVRAAPKVGCVGDEGVGTLDDGKRFFSTPDEEGCTTGGGCTAGHSRHARSSAACAPMVRSGGGSGSLSGVAADLRAAIT
jgi:hypothetical protein